jgi:N-acetylglucosamine kinase-like BadF-type ATPase
MRPTTASVLSLASLPIVMPCQLQDAFLNIDAALQDALKRPLEGSPWPFARTLLALAGCDSPVCTFSPVSEVAYSNKEAETRVAAFAVDHWKIPDATSLLVTNDSALLAAGIALPPHQDCTNGIVLVSGTGSVCASYSLEEQKISLVAREGG